MTIEKLAEVLRASPEYKEKFGNAQGQERKEDITQQIGVDAVIHLTETNILSALMRSQLFREYFKPRMDLGAYIEANSTNKELYKQFYEMKEKGELDLKKLVELVLT